MVRRWLGVMLAFVARTPSNRLGQLALAAGVTGVVFFGLLNGPPILAQSSSPDAAPLPSFEVASVRRSPPREGTSFHLLPNRLTYTNMVTERIIDLAYGRDMGEIGFSFLRHDQLVGGPSWVRDQEFGYEGYDIDAKVDDSLAEKFGKDCGPAFFHGSCGYREQMLLMLQSLLADRFKLKVRRETKELPVYALVVAKGGPKFLHTKFEVPDYTAVPPPPRPPCPTGVACMQDYMSMGLMAERLSGLLSYDDRPVIDRTGLKGGYYIKLQYVWQRPSTPSIFTALQQQLGLKLKPTKGPVEYLVIDHIERPSEN